MGDHAVSFSAHQASLAEKTAHFQLALPNESRSLLQVYHSTNHNVCQCYTSNLSDITTKKHPLRRMGRGCFKKRKALSHFKTAPLSVSSKVRQKGSGPPPPANGRCKMPQHYWLYNRSDPKQSSMRYLLWNNHNGSLLLLQLSHRRRMYPGRQHRTVARHLHYSSSSFLCPFL